MNLLCCVRPGSICCFELWPVPVLSWTVVCSLNLPCRSEQMLPNARFLSFFSIYAAVMNNVLNSKLNEYSLSTDAHAPMAGGGNSHLASQWPQEAQGSFARLQLFVGSLPKYPFFLPWADSLAVFCVFLETAFNSHVLYKHVGIQHAFDNGPCLLWVSFGCEISLCLRLVFCLLP